MSLHLVAFNSTSTCHVYNSACKHTTYCTNKPYIAQSSKQQVITGQQMLTLVYWLLLELTTGSPVGEQIWNDRTTRTRDNW